MGDFEKKAKNVSKREVCRNFLKNRCARGATCKYEHSHSSSHTNRSRSRSPVSSKNESRSDICRDFIRNICKRGANCRFYHPPKEEVENKKAWFTLCLDFQNGKCSRSDCRYFHVSVEDEENFKRSGEIPSHIVHQAMSNAPNLDIAIGGTKPICKDFLRGYCKLQVCRFRHVSLHDYEDEIYKGLHQELSKLFEPSVHSRRYPNDFAPPPRRMMYGDEEGEGFDRVSFDKFEMQSPDNFSVKLCDFNGMRRNFLDNQPSPLREAIEDFSNTESEIMFLRRELNELRDQVRYTDNQIGNIDQGAFNKIKSSNEKFVINNSELHDNVRMLNNENESLLNKVRDLGVQQENYLKEIQDLKDQVSNLKTQLYNFKIDQQSFDNIQRASRQEEALKLQNQIHVVENELAHSWGGGPPIAPSLRDAWSILKNMCNFIARKNSMSREDFATVGTNGAASGSSGRTNFNLNSTGFDGSNSASQSHLSSSDRW